MRCNRDRDVLLYSSELRPNFQNFQHHKKSGPPLPFQSPFRKISRLYFDHPKSISMDSAAHSRENPKLLACLGCKSRKIRCDHARPTCDGCFARQQPCIYPDKRKRPKPNATSTRSKPARISDNFLSVLLDRVLQVEEKCSRIITATDKGRSPVGSTPATRDDFGSSPNTPSVVSTPHSRTEIATSPKGTTIDPDSIPKELDSSHTPNLSAETLNVDARLKQAVDQVLHLKRQSLVDQTASVDYYVSPELSKACLDNFCKHYLVDIFQDFINLKLMYLLPDIINFREISIQPSTRILYFSILYHGSLMISPETRPYVENLTQLMYVQCLRAMPAWRKHVSGTKTDLITAILLMRASWEQCDTEFSWTMYTLVCGCVRKLDIHNLDQAFASPVVDTTSCTEGADHHRKGFWALVLTDIFFRMLHDKPAILTANMAEWHVNLPSIDTAAVAAEPVIPTLTFFVRSRLTFLLLRLDILSHDAEDKNSIIKSIEGLCEEIEALFQEWSVEDSMAAYEEIAGFWWMLCELTLTAYCSMMTMSRELAVLQSGLSDASTVADNVPITLLSVNIARRIINLANLAIRNYPGTAAVSCFFSAFRCYVAYGCLAKHLFTSDPKASNSSAESDMVLLEEVAHKVATIAERDKDLVPLVGAFHDLNRSIRAKWED